MFWTPDVNIAKNSDTLNAFLQSLCAKGYVFDTLIEGCHQLYVIQRSQDSKCWLVSEEWWFNGINYNGEEYWFEWIDTQEMWDQTIIECRWENNSHLFELQDGTLIAKDLDETTLSIQDLLDMTAAQANRKLN